jgi:hypothetical protein
MPAPRWLSAIALLGAGLLLAELGGCAPLSELPDMTKLPEKLLTKSEQQGKVNEMIEKGQKHQSEAAKEIEHGK